jgi:hypothetical protein
MRNAVQVFKSKFSDFMPFNHFVIFHLSKPTAVLVSIQSKVNTVRRLGMRG